MFELSIEKSESPKDYIYRYNLFRKSLESITDMVEDVELKISDLGIEISVMDSNYTAFAEFFLAKNIFSTYRCDRKGTLGLKIKPFLERMNRVNISSLISFKIICDSNDLLLMEFETDDSTIKNEIKLFTFSTEQFELDEDDFAAEITLNSSKFSQVFRELSDIGEYLLIDVDKDMLNFAISGDDVSSKFNLKEHSNINLKKPVKRDLPVKQLKNILKVSDLTNTIKISLDTMMPARFIFQLGEFGTLKYFIAPHLEYNEE